MSILLFPCGCQFQVEDGKDEVIQQDPLSPLPLHTKIDMYNIPQDCHATWDLLSSGQTKGVFQLEGNLGRTWAKKVKPQSLNDLAALVALLRPGCLRSYSGEPPKNMPQHYCDRKHGIDEIDNFGVVELEPILKDTYGILCIHEDTYISMADGTEKQIKHIKPEDKIVSVQQSTHQNTLDVCVNILPSPQTQGIKLVLENGFRITLTLDHKVETQRGLVEVQNLDPNKDVVQIILKQDNWNGVSEIDDGKYDEICKNKEDLAYLCGQLLGDGCAAEAICVGTETPKDILYQWLCKKFPHLNFSTYFHLRAWYISICGKYLLEDNNYGNRKTTYRWFVEQLTLDKTKHNKIIHDSIFTASVAVRRAFLAGLFDADGHSSIASNGISSICHYCSDNPQVINGIRKLLSLDGIATYITSDYKHLHINNQDRFKKLIEPFMVVKSVVGRATTAVHYGSFPNEYLYDKAHSLHYKHPATFRKAYGLSSNCMKKSNPFINIETIEKTGIDFNDVCFMRIKKMTPTDNKQGFYSISVHKNHNLIGNGVVISNCYQESAMQISVSLAGFNEQEADILRKSIGKKSASLMAEVEKGFLDGCAAKAIVSKEKAEMIFGWIKESQRYGFNRSVTPDTLVTKSDGSIVTLDEISIGDYITCPKDDGGDTVVMVTNKFEHGRQEIYEVKLDNGKTIRCTLQHKLMCGDKQMHRLIDIIHHHYLVYTEDGLAEVKKATPIGRARTVDIEVDNENHVYYANGIATSNSHAISYGQLSYWTAFAKTHAPTPFFCSYLKGANWKQDRYKEISELISDAKTMNIRVNVPDFRALKMDFNIQDRDIFFGLSGVRGLGKSNLKKIVGAANETIKLLDKQLSQWTWLDYLLYFSPLVSSTVNKSLINSGSLTFLHTDRKRMLYEYEQWKGLTKKEQEWVQNAQYENGTLTLPAYQNLVDLLISGARPKKEGGACSNKNRIEKMESAITILSNPPTSLVDTPHSIAINETHHMGVALTCAEIDGCVGASDADITCLDIITNEVGGGSIAVSLNEVKEIKTKNKKQMAFMIVSDASCTLESVVVFPDQWTEHSDKLYVGNNVLLTGHKDKDRGGFIVDDAWQI